MLQLNTYLLFKHGNEVNDSLVELVDRLPEDLLGTVAFLATVPSAGACEIIVFLGDVRIHQDSFMRKMDRHLLHQGFVGVQKGAENRYFLTPLGKEATPMVVARLEQTLTQHQHEFATHLIAAIAREAKLGRWLGKDVHAHWQEVGRCIQCGNKIPSPAKGSALHAQLQRLEALLKGVYSGEL